MDLTVSVIVLSFGLEVTQVHRNHRSFLFINIQEFNQTRFETISEIHALLCLHIGNMTLPEKKLALFSNKKGSLDTTSVSEEPNLFVLEVPHNRNLFRYVISPSEPNYVVHESIWVL